MICRTSIPCWLAVGVPTSAMAADLNLICSGEGAARRVETTQGYASNSYGESATATLYSQRSEEFADQVNVEIRGGEGRIRLPRTMLPPIHGGENGWMQLTDIRETPDEITAKAQVNFMSRPDVRIDRIAGTISISGRVGRYIGQCDAYNPETVRRRF